MHDLLNQSTGDLLWNLRTLVAAVAMAILGDNCKVFTLYLAGHSDLLWNVISKHDN